MTTEPSARIVADSISPAGDRLTTMEVVMHRFVLAEFNTHRVFSRNSASSRAIPIAKQLVRVLNDPALPLSWPAEQKGMQGGDELEEGKLTHARNIWGRARLSAWNEADVLQRMGLHKSVVNRLLEPFMWHTVVVTSTAWENFFGLRRSPMAQPEIRVAAEAMWVAYEESTPTLVEEGTWHMPYVSADEIEDGFIADEDLPRISAARVARTSYLTHAGVRDPNEDVALYRKLTAADPMHASPLEQVATPAPQNKHNVWPPGFEHGLTLPLYGNLLGWHQLRFDVEAERGYRAYT